MIFLYVNRKRLKPIRNICIKVIQNQKSKKWQVYLNYLKN